MSRNDLGVFALECEAPQEAVVEAFCQYATTAGLVRPGDVAWRQAPVLGPNRCRCRRYCGDMQEFELTFNDGHTETYAILQCQKCKTIWWRQRKSRMALASI